MMVYTYNGPTWRLSVGNEFDLPEDLQCHIEHNGTKTWYSQTHGALSNGDFLRKYVSGTYSIGLGTWWSNVDLDKNIEEKLFDSSDDFVLFLQTAKAELARRIVAIEK